MHGFTAILFDFDGTLIDTVPSIAEAVNAILSEHGRPGLSDEAVEPMVGDGAPVLLSRAFAATGDPLDAAALSGLLARYDEHLVAHPPGPERIYPGVPETLERLAAAGVALGICSNKPERPARDTLAKLGLDTWFGSLIGGDTLPQRKPAPEPAWAALKALGCAPESAALVGDSANDVGTARAAGMPAIAVSYGYPRMPIEDLGADIVIDRFADLPNALSRLSLGDLAAK